MLSAQSQVIVPFTGLLALTRFTKTMRFYTVLAYLYSFRVNTIPVKVVVNYVLLLTMGS
jgi:hypothetical protein